MSDKELEFHEMGLDDRLLKAIAKLGWGKPTPIQEKAVPLILEGKDVLARARTGSGKTVVGTPSRILAHLKAGHLTLKLEMLVIDEADLVLSFGHEQDLNELLTRLPNKKESRTSNGLAQYVIRCEEDDKFALLCALFKLRLIVGKTLIFVTTVDRCFVVKLFLEQFGIRCCVLNSELPLASRALILNQFNEGRYEIMVASDEKGVEVQDKAPKKSKKRNQDPEYGVCRGLDFQNVANVINLDFPATVQAYQHRVGRTARGDRKGTALSLVKDREAHLLEAVQKALPEGTLRPYLFRMEEIEPFRYRSKDAFRAVTRIAVREARLKEIKTEMLSSQKLQSFFEENPRERQLLRHDKALHIIKHQPHLKHCPDYIIPPTLQRSLQKEGATKAPQQPVKRPMTREAKEPKVRQEAAEETTPLQTFSCD
ncbi:hypothetical protein MTO96_017732 [Rhipicephalus appendiculatus]